MKLQDFLEQNEDLINEAYIEHHFETIGHGGDYDPLDKVDEKLWEEIGEKLYEKSV